MRYSVSFGKPTTTTGLSAGAIAGIVVGVLLCVGGVCCWVLVIKGLLTLPCIKKPAPPAPGPPVVVVTQPAAWGEVKGVPLQQGGYALNAAAPPPMYAVPPPPGTVVAAHRIN
jgi:hypothetical protein